MSPLTCVVYNVQFCTFIHEVSTINQDKSGLGFYRFQPDPRITGKCRSALRCFIFYFVWFQPLLTQFENNMRYLIYWFTFVSAHFTATSQVLRAPVLNGSGASVFACAMYRSLAINLLSWMTALCSKQHNIRESPAVEQLGSVCVRVICKQSAIDYELYIFIVLRSQELVVLRYWVTVSNLLITISNGERRGSRDASPRPNCRWWVSIWLRIALYWRQRTES